MNKYYTLLVIMFVTIITVTWFMDLLFMQSYDMHNNGVEVSSAITVPHSLHYYGFSDHAADLHINAIRKEYSLKGEKFNLIYDDKTIQSILSLTMDDLWWKHRDICETVSHKNIVNIQNKISTVQILRSNEFNQYLLHYKHNINHFTVKDLKLSIRYFEMTYYEWINITKRSEKHNEFITKTTKILQDNNYWFVLKPSHLSWSHGLHIFDINCWNKQNMTTTKLWNMLTSILMIKIDDSATGVVRNTNNNSEILNPGVIIESRFKNCIRNDMKYCGRNEISVGAGKPREIKIQTLFGRIIQAGPIYHPLMSIHRDGSYECLFDARPTYGSESNNDIIGLSLRNETISIFCENLWLIIKDNWNDIVFWTEVIAKYVGADRLRVDWFYDEDTFQFNEIAYPGSRKFDIRVEQTLERILYKIYHNYLNEIIA